MNKRYKKMLATGLALNMILINVPYNVFANSDMIEKVLLNDENIPLVNEVEETNLDNLINKDEQTLNDEDLIKESDAVNDEATSELLEPIIEEDYSNVLENNINENISNGVIDFTEYKKIVKSIIPSVTNYADSFAGGNGTEENPYQISNALELARLAYLVNEEDLNTTGMYFELTNDIDLSDFDTDNNDANGNWTPIGYMERVDSGWNIKPFNGIFNGNDYTISNMIVKEDYVYGGLFGVVGSSKFKNLSFKNCSIYNIEYAGVLIGYVRDKVDVENVNISNSNLESLYFAGSNISMGSLIGYIGWMSYDKSSTNINKVNIDNTLLKINSSTSSRDGDVGGLIGKIISPSIDINDITIKSSLNSYNMSGLVSYLDNVTESPLSIKNIKIELTFLDYDYKSYCVSGLLGQAYFKLKDNDSVIIENCDILINNKLATPTYYMAGLLGNTGIRGTGNNINITNINIDVSGHLYASSYTAGISGYSDSDCVINISNAIINANLKSNNSGALLGGVAGWSSGLKVDNIIYEGDISCQNAYGYAGGISGGHSFKVLEIENSYVDFTVSGEKLTYVGGIIGHAGALQCDTSKIKNNFIKVSVDKVKDIEFVLYAGGIIGYFESSKPIEISENEIFINMTSTDNAKLGGIVGELRMYSKEATPIISNNLIVGNIDSESKNKGYLFGELNDYYSNNPEINISNICIAMDINDNFDAEDLDTYLYKELSGGDLIIDKIYYDNTVSPLKDSLAIGLTTEQMQGLNAKENMLFDYENVWKLNKEYYPTFRQLNTAPELSGNDIELILNQEYNLLDYVTVEDFEDKDLIPQIETDLDITKIGDYTAKFTVTDPGGLTDELALNIKVVAEKPIINAKDLTLYIGDKFNPLDKVTAIDINGNDITEHIKVIENTVDTSRKGVYKVVYQVDSLERLTTTKEIKITVLEKVSNNNNSDNKVESDKNESSTTNKPQTGDNFTVYGISLLASLVGLLYINRKSKKRRLK